MKKLFQRLTDRIAAINELRRLLKWADIRTPDALAYVVSEWMASNGHIYEESA